MEIAVCRLKALPVKQNQARSDLCKCLTPLTHVTLLFM